MSSRSIAISICAWLCTLTPGSVARCAEPASRPSLLNEKDQTGRLTPEQWQDLNACVEKALRWLAHEQMPDGSFPTQRNGQPAVTALCALAFLSADRGNGTDEYEQVIRRAIEYILASQKSSGLIARVAPDGDEPFGVLEDAQAASYNHAISGLALSEAYGMAKGHDEPMRIAIQAAIRHALGRQPSPKAIPGDNGGWRYRMRFQSSDSDLSVTSWHLMFLRSCKNSGFDIPKGVMEEGSAYIRRCFEPRTGFFWYALRGQEHVTTRAMTAAAVLSLSMAGQHQTEVALQAGDWILSHPHMGYRMGRNKDRFFYDIFYCSQAMFQLGGRYWQVFYPHMLSMLKEGQRPDGSWHSEPGFDREYGNAYTTALAVLALSPPYQILPIFQR